MCHNDPGRELGISSVLNLSHVHRTTCRRQPATHISRTLVCFPPVFVHMGTADWAQHGHHGQHAVSCGSIPGHGGCALSLLPSSATVSEIYCCFFFFFLIYCRQSYSVPPPPPPRLCTSFHAWPGDLAPPSSIRVIAVLHDLAAGLSSAAAPMQGIEP